MKIPENFKAALDEACAKFQITGARKAAFLAHCSVESAGFTRLQENLFYTTPERIMQIFPSKVKSLVAAKLLARNPKALANVVYAGKLGNGPSTSNDGWNFAGKGLFQLTGKDNYLEAEKALGYPYSTRPELLLEPKHAALTAAWFWFKTGCNEAIDRGDFSTTTRRINGPAQLHAKERMAVYDELLSHYA